ncbi:MAG: hypothetical protein QW073_05160 [Desulfurococcaceae archaeon]
MGRHTAENQVNKPARLLLLASGLATALASVLHLLVALQPLYRFHGLIQGYYSLLSYSLVCIVNQQRVSMPHTDYLWHVSLVYTFSTLTVLLVSVTSLLTFRRRITVSMGLIHGCSSTLIVIHGLLRNYILRAVELDVARFNGLTGDMVTVETLAGKIVFTGVMIEPTWVHHLALSWLILTLVVFAVVSSTVSIAFATKGLNETTRRTRAELLRLGDFIHGFLPVLLVLPLLLSKASIFNYQPMAVSVNPQPPPVTLEPALYDYTCTGLSRTSRGSLTYTDFEAYPISGWTSYGGIWSTLTGAPGAKGNVLQGSDNNGGLGAASHYYYGTRLDAYTSLWVAVKTRWASGGGYYGISMMNAARSRMYTVELSSTGYLEVWSYNVVTTAWSRHARVSVPGYSQENWYTIVVSYSVQGTTTSITAYLYDASGSHVTAVSATITHSNVFTPAYLGVEVDNVLAYFDEFIVSTVDPRFLYFTGFYEGMGVEVWDNIGYLVNTTVAPAPSFALGVTGDVVVGTGSNGRIVVRYPDAYLCGVLTVPSTDAVLGGDTYALSAHPITLSLGANRTSATITLYVSNAPAFDTTARILRVNASQALYARLILDAYTAPESLNLDIWIEGSTKSTNILVRSGVPISTLTSIVQLNTGQENSIAVSGHFTATGQTATLHLKLELCTLPGGGGACVYYSVTLTLSSGSS